MGKEHKVFEDYISQSIILNNNHGIEEVNNLKSIKSMCFDSNEYLSIKELIKSKNLEQVLNLPVANESKCEEFLEIMTFSDQRKAFFIVTVYDSNALWQDPQVIDIFDDISN